MNIHHIILIVCNLVLSSVVIAQANWLKRLRRKLDDSIVDKDAWYNSSVKLAQENIRQERVIKRLHEINRELKNKEDSDANSPATS